MTDMQFAVFAALRKEPKYWFVGNELSAAERMERRGWLKRLRGNRFEITAEGSQEFAKVCFAYEIEQK